NTDYIFFRPHVDRFFTPLGDDRFAVNQDAMVKLVGFAGNMTVSNRKLQAVLKA
ncbi:MAG: phage major capsid protein, partial [Proteobacteria bacterium]|nr:phage major capsid protein [Pseudomonadota bacterium]